MYIYTCTCLQVQHKYVRCTYRREYTVLCGGECTVLCGGECTVLCGGECTVLCGGEYSCAVWR